MVERIRYQALIIHGYTYAGHAHGSGGLHCSRKGVFLDNEDVASGGEHPKRHIEPGGRSDGHGATPICVRGVMHHFSVLGDEPQ